MGASGITARLMRATAAAVSRNVGLYSNPAVKTGLLRGMNSCAAGRAGSDGPALRGGATAWGIAARLLRASATASASAIEAGRAGGTSAGSAVGTAGLIAARRTCASATASASVDKVGP